MPFVYEAFRPFLVSHFIFQFPGDPGMSTLDHDEYKNLSFRAYYISSDSLLVMSATAWAVIFALVIICDILVSVAVKKFES